MRRRNRAVVGSERAAPSAIVNQGSLTFMKYVDGFVVPVPKTKLDAYRRMSRKMGMPFDPKRMFWGGFKTMVRV